MTILLLGLAAAPVMGQIGTGSSAGIGGFGGPAVLGRGAANGAPARSPEMGFRYYGGVNLSYDTGLTGFALDANGNVLNAGSQGVEGVYGVYGVKRSRRTLVSLNYAGGYRHYTNVRGFNGLDQNLTLSVSKQLNARTAFGLGVNAGTTNRAFGFGGVSGYVDPNFVGFGLPSAEIFDNRIYYGGASANYIWQRTARSSISLTGAGFLTRRSGKVLFGVNGANTSADYAYRISRNQTINIGYTYVFFNFTRGFGDTHAHGAFLGYGARIARKYNVAVRGGGLRMQNLFLQRVAVDPVIAAIVGITETQQVRYRVSYMPTANVSLSGPVTRRSTFDISAGLFAMPGNGVITTSRNWNVGGTYSYTGLKRMGLGASVFYNEMSSLIGTNQKFSSVNTSIGATPRMAGDWHLNLAAGTRHFLDGPTNNFRRNSYFVNLGVFWSPGELPLNFR
jgi:hypothetical protein